MGEVLTKLLGLQARVFARSRLDGCSRALFHLSERLSELAEARKVFAHEAAVVEWACEEESYLLAARQCVDAHHDAGMAYRNFQGCFEAVPVDARQTDLVKLAASLAVERRTLSMYDAPLLQKLSKAYRELEGAEHLFDPAKPAASESGEHECEGP